MADTKIEWADKVYNPITGCTPISQGCEHCYASSVARRFWKGRKFSDIRIGNDTVLSQPMHWRKPQRIFVGSMTDLFHDDIPFHWLDKIFSIMAMANWHTYMVLTKRPDRMKKYMDSCQVGADEVGGKFPWNHVWLGVTAENQEQADKRIPVLLKTPAAKHFISYEPALGPLDLSFYVDADHPDNEGYGVEAIQALDWIIMGSESGTGARKMPIEWAEDVAFECFMNGTPLFYKQGPGHDGKYGKMPIIGGRVWDQYPEVKS